MRRDFRDCLVVVPKAGTLPVYCEASPNFGAHSASPWQGLVKPGVFKYGQALPLGTRIAIAYHPAPAGGKLLASFDFKVYCHRRVSELEEKALAQNAMAES